MRIDWNEHRLSELRRLAATDTPLSEMRRILDVPSIGAVQNKLRTLGIRLARSPRSPEQIRASRYDVGPRQTEAPKFQPHRTSTARLMGDPPPGRTEWS